MATQLSDNEAIEAAVFRQLVKHLQDNKDVQNIDLMNLAGFCQELPCQMVCG